jgi:hypothetical protein
MEELLNESQAAQRHLIADNSRESFCKLMGKLYSIAVDSDDYK